MNELKKKIIMLSENFGIKELEQIEDLIEKELKKDSRNIDLWLRLAILELVPPLVDYEKSLTGLYNVLRFDKNNPIAMLLIAYINYYFLAGVDKALFNKLTSIETADLGKKSMLLYAASWFYRNDDLIDKKELLKKSINACGRYVYNYIQLARLYLNEGKKWRRRCF